VKWNRSALAWSLLVFLEWRAAASAPTNTLIFYQVNDTDAATIAAGVVPNLGTLGAGSNYNGVTLTNDLPTNGVLAGAGDRALVCNGADGILAPGTQQLNRTNISNAGGFTYEAWFNWNGGGDINAIIDYAGTEKLIRQETQTGPQMETDNATFDLIGAAAVNQWHYVAVVFTATNTVTSTDSISGIYTFYLDTNTPIGTVTGITINSNGDSLDRTIGVGTHPVTTFTSDFFNGLIYEPRVTLGALSAGSLLFKSTLLVTNLADSGPGTLRAVTAQATTGAIINFAPSLAGQTILLTNGQIPLSNNVVIDASALANGIQVNGNGLSRIFQVASNTRVTLNFLTLTNGNEAFSNTNGGGAIWNLGTLKLNNCIVAGNSADDASQGGGAILSQGSLVINNSTFSGNHADDGFASGGAIASLGSLAISNSTFSGNHANGSAGGGGALNGFATTTINSSTFVGNEANNTGFLGSGAVGNSEGSMTINNSTFFGNTALNNTGGALGDYNGGTLTVNNCTIVGNQAAIAGGIYANAGTLRLTNCIVSLNGEAPGYEFYDDIYGTGITVDAQNILFGPGDIELEDSTSVV
jgi:hypothetical protein